jgi:hypothetical protein
VNGNATPAWTRQPPAADEAIEELVRTAGIPLPPEYLAFLRETNGGEGELGVQPGWFVMWHAEEVVSFNRDYEVAANAPGLLGFGSSGGGELLAFDTRGGQPYPVVAVPFIGMSAKDALLVAPSFATFETAMGGEWSGE